MAAEAREPIPDSLLICYCTNLTMGELRAACRAGHWPPPGKDGTGKRCTGCLGDVNFLLKAGGREAPA